MGRGDNYPERVNFMNEILTLEEAIKAAIDRKQLQFHTRGQWVDSNSNGKVVGLIMHVVSSREFHWRIKPNAFEEAWAAEFQKPLYKTFDRDSISKAYTIFEAGWNAAMEHKNNE